MGIEAVRLAADGDEVLGEAPDVPDVPAEVVAEEDADEVDEDSGGAATNISF